MTASERSKRKFKRVKYHNEPEMNYVKQLEEIINKCEQLEKPKKDETRKRSTERLFEKINQIRIKGKN